MVIRGRTGTFPDLAHLTNVVRAVEKRGMGPVAIFGHSWGGGGTYELAARLQATPPQGNYTLAFTAYIDAIQWHVAGVPQTDRPRGSEYHVNYYQRHLLIRGNAGDANFNLNVNDTGWGAGLTHTSIDNHANVRGRILDGSTAGGIEGPHNGLRQKIAR
jgi:hypothetical protein